MTGFSLFSQQDFELFVSLYAGHTCESSCGTWTVYAMKKVMTEVLMYKDQ